jgi:Na+/H+ antiporter
VAVTTALAALQIGENPGLVTGLEVVLGLVAVVVMLALMARRVSTPLPVFLVLGGLVLGVVWRFVPGLAAPSLAPGLAYLLFLPPLLASAAFDVPFGAFRANLRPITLLAVGLVLATMTVVAYVAHWALPALPLSVGFVLGAIVSPPDPVAASSVARNLGLPNGVVTILEGEGLINDATALVSYKLALGVVATGMFSWSGALLDFARSSAVGVGTGLVIGWLTTLVLRHIDDPVLETTVTLLAPYIAFIAADELGGSAVLAAVTIGFFLRHRNIAIEEPGTRLAQRTVWSALVFLINGVVFVLIGIQLGGLPAEDIGWPLARGALAVIAGVILLRLLWMYGTPWVLRAITFGRYPTAIPPARELTVLGWSGMRGVVSLAAVLSLPFTVSGGEPFPGRAICIWITFAVILATLVVQGLTLPPLIRVLGMTDPHSRSRELELAWRYARAAGRRRLCELEHAGAIDDGTRAEVEAVLMSARPARDAHPERTAGEARQLVIRAQREAVSRVRDRGIISSGTAEELERELDVELVRVQREDERTAQHRRS